MTKTFKRNGLIVTALTFALIAAYLLFPNHPSRELKREKFQVVFEEKIGEGAAEKSYFQLKADLLVDIAKDSLGTRTLAFELTGNLPPSLFSSPRLAGEFTLDKDLQLQSLKLSKDMDPSHRSLFEQIFLVLSPDPDQIDSLRKLKTQRGTHGTYQVDYSYDDASRTLALQRELKNAAAHQSKRFSSIGDWKIRYDDKDSIREVAGKERKIVYEEDKVFQIQTSYLTIIAIDAPQPSKQINPAPELTRYDAFSDRRLSWADRRPVWQQTLKDADVPATLDSLKKSKVDNSEKMHITQVLEARYSLDPQLIPELEHIIETLNPSDDGFHLALIILANLRVSEVNEVFQRLAAKFEKQPKALETLALYFNDLQFPDEPVLTLALKQASNLSEDNRSALRFALATGSMISNSQNDALADKFTTVLEEKLDQSKSVLERKIWLSALGNAASESSLNTILAYVRGADEDLSVTAINALRKFPYESFAAIAGEIVQSGSDNEILQLIKILAANPPAESEWTAIKASLQNHPSQAVRKRIDFLESNRAG